MSSPCGSNILLKYFSFSGSYHRGGVSPSSTFLRDYATWQFNAFLWISLIYVNFLLLSTLYDLLRLWIKGNRIPGPPCPSFYGHSKFISAANFTEVVSALHDEYGSVVKLWLDPTQLLVSIKDTELIREMLVKAEDIVPLTGRAYHLAFGRSSLFASSFGEVQKTRDILAEELRGEFLERAVVVSPEVLNSVMKKILDFKGRESLDCKTVSQHLAFTIMGGTLFGDEFLVWSKATLYEELLMMIAKDAYFWASYGCTPFWRRGFWRYQYLCTKLKSLTKDIIQQCRKNYNLLCQEDQISQNECTCNGQGSTLTMISNLFTWDDNDCISSGEQPCGEMESVMFHGCLSTAHLIGNILTTLASDPEIQNKVYSEIVSVWTNMREPMGKRIEHMPFMLATVYESARLLPAVPLLQRCALKHDIKLKTGVTIPAGAILMVPVQLLQTDSSNWGADACLFNPDRFLSKPGKSSHAIHMPSFPGFSDDHEKEFSYKLNDPNENVAFLPFGSGTRAIFAVATLFASLLERFEVRRQSGLEDDTVSNKSDGPLELHPNPKIVFVPRSK